MDRKKRNLSAGETFVFIKIWRKFVKDLRRTKRNAPILLKFKKMLAEEQNLKIDVNEIRNKINNLTKKYRIEKRNLMANKSTPSNWMYYNAVHETIGDYKSNFKGENTKEKIEDTDTLTLSSTSSWEMPANASPSQPMLSPKVEISSPLPSPPSPTGSISSLIGSRRRAKEDGADKILIMMQRQLDLYISTVAEEKRMDCQLLDLLKEHNSLLREHNTILRDLVNKNTNNNSCN